MTRSAPLSSVSSTPSAATISPPSFHRVWGGVVSRIFAPDSTRAWVVEDGGRIRFTKDSGHTWVQQDTPDAARGTLKGIHFLDDLLHGWAVADDGFVLATASGGARGWTLVNSGPIVDPTAPARAALLYDVWFSDTQHGWLAGLHLLQRTVDGGRTWIDVDLRDAQGHPLDRRTLEVYSLAFLVQGSQLLGLAVAEPGIILRTTDPQGARWTAVLDIDDPQSLQPACNSTAALEIWDVAFVPGTMLPDARAYAVSGLGNGCGYMFGTKDGGRTWQQESYVPGGLNQHTRAFALYGVSAFADGGAIACGYGGQVLVRDAAQPVWRDVTNTQSLPTQPLLSIACDPHPGLALSAWTVGDFDAIRRSNDRGKSWSEQAGTQAWRLLALDFPPSPVGAVEITGWVAGQQYRIARSVDSGQTWTQQRAEVSGSVDFGHSLKSLAFADALNGIAAGIPSTLSNQPVIYFTNSGGEVGTWIRASVPATLSGTDFRAACFSGVNALAQNEFWVAGANGRVARSVDGGANWSEVLVQILGRPSPPRWFAVAFLDAVTGYFVGTWPDGSAAAVRIENAQSATPSWIDLSPGIPGAFHSVAIDPVSGRTYAVGSGGSVYKRDAADRRFVPVPEAMSLVPASLDLNAVCVIPAGTNHELWAAGGRGFLLHFSNAAWTAPRSATSLTLVGISFANPARGFAVGGLQEGTSVLVEYSMQS